MTVRFVAVAACAAAVWCTALPAFAACELKAMTIPVTMRGLRPMVTAKVNGQEGRFALDSGSMINVLNGKFAAGLKLKPVGIEATGSHLSVDRQVGIRGVAGADSINGVVQADSFDFVGMAFKNVQFMATDQLKDVDGLLGQAFLRRVDVEYDFRGGVVRLARPEGCRGANMAYWAKDGAAYSMMPLESMDRNNPHTAGTITVNGVRLRAVFDTGAPSSLITEGAAARAGVRTGSPGVVPIGEGHGLDGAFKAWVGNFADVRIGDEELKNAPMVIGQSAAGFDVLLGADFFLSHHVYVANSQEKLYFTYSGGPPFRVPQPKPATAAAPK